MVRYAPRGLVGSIGEWFRRRSEKPA